MCAHWYPEGYVLPTSTAYPPGPHHPSYTPKVTSFHGAPKPWYAPHVQGSSQERSRPSPSPASRSSSSSHTNTSTDGFSASMPSHTMAGIGDPGLVSGVDYFKVLCDTLKGKHSTNSVLPWLDRRHCPCSTPYIFQYLHRLGLWSSYASTFEAIQSRYNLFVERPRGSSATTKIRMYWADSVVIADNWTRTSLLRFIHRSS